MYIFQKILIYLEKILIYYKKLISIEITRHSII